MAVRVVKIQIIFLSLLSACRQAELLKPQIHLVIGSGYLQSCFTLEIQMRLGKGQYCIVSS